MKLPPRDMPRLNGLLPVAKYGLGGFPGNSAGKESACNAGDSGSIPGSGRSTGEGIPTSVFLGFSGGSTGKESTCNSGDLGLVPGLRRSPGEQNGYPLQYSGLESSIDYSMGLQRVGHD